MTNMKQIQSTADSKTTLNKLKDKLNLEIHTIWDTKNQRFVRVFGYPFRCKEVSGVWTSKELLIKDIPLIKNLEEYEIITFDMTHKVPEDIIRIFTHTGLEDFEKENLSRMKLRQLIQVFIFRNHDIIEGLKEKYKRPVIHELSEVQREKSLE